MQFTGEITLGAIGIIVSIISTGIGGVSALAMVYAKTRGEIDNLKIGHADLKVDLAKIEAKQDVNGASLQQLHVMIERVAARQEIMGAISNLPNDLATAISKIVKRDDAR
jgi:hypothetical protein